MKPSRRLSVWRNAPSNAGLRGGDAKGRWLVRVCVGCVVLALCASAQAQDAKPPLVEPLVPPGSVEAADDASSSSGLEHRVGVRAGWTYSALDRPEDAAGEPTLLAGSAFTGSGWVAGATYELAGLAPYVALGTGVIYSVASGAGFEERGSAKREITLEATTLRVPVVARLKYPVVAQVELVAGLGVEAVFGLTSSSVVDEENVPADDQFTLETVSVNTLHMLGQVGAEIDLGRVRLPLDLFLSVNPLTRSTTRERFEDYGGADNPGPFRAEFDLEFAATFGVVLVL